MKFILVICIFITSAQASKVFLDPDISKHQIEQKLKSSLFFEHTIKDIIKLIKYNHSDFNFTNRIFELKDAQNKTLDLIFLNQEYLLKQDEKVKLALISIKKELNKYAQKSAAIKNEKIEHFYIDRMNCEKTEAECYDLIFTDYLKDYHIPYFATYNYLKEKLSLYQKEPGPFLNKIMLDLEITLPPEKNFFEQFFDQDNASEEITIDDIADALSIMLAGLSEFINDENEYKKFLEEKLIELAIKHDLQVEHLVASDIFQPNTIRIATGKIELTRNMSAFLSSNPKILQDINTLYTYFEDLDLTKFLKE